MQVLVDDTLALLANLGVLDLPEEIERPLATVYAFQLRLAGALAVDRPTVGRLQRLVSLHPPPTGGVTDLLRSRTEAVETVDPTQHAPAIALLKARYGSFIPAEVIAIARGRGLEVRLSEGNATGHLVEALAEEQIPYAVWMLRPDGGRYAVDER